MKHYETPEYHVWAGIIQRCTNPKRADYPRYGGRGVTICTEWRESFHAFRAHVGERPSPRHTIDRIDNARGYEPGNVRWATMQHQQRNRTNNRYLTVHGVTKLLAEWAEESDLPPYLIRLRLHKGWSDERAVLTPLGPQGRKAA